MLRHNLQSETCVHPLIVFISDGARNVVSHLFSPNSCLIFSVASLPFISIQKYDNGNILSSVLIDSYYIVGTII